MFDIGFSELVVILAAALILFGPRRLPRLAKAAGESLKAFRDGLKEAAEASKPDA